MLNGLETQHSITAYRVPEMRAVAKTAYKWSFAECASTVRWVYPRANG